MKNSANCSLKGFVKVDVIDHTGRVVREGRKQRNLLLDQGLDRLAAVSICDMFLFAVKGNDTLAMSEAVTGTYTLDDGAATVTRISGARDFVSGDVGSLIYSQNNIECIIVSVTSVSVVDVRPVGTEILTAYAAKTITLYAVQATGIATEDSRTGDFSSLPLDNSTTTASGNVRTFKRTFLFAAEAANIETPATTTYTWTGTGVVRTGTRDFVSADVGKYLKFTDGEYCKISVITNTSTVVVDRPPVATITADAGVTIYGYNSYSHIGFSDVDTAGANLNVMVRLESSPGTPSPVLALGANPEVAGQQVKVTYILQVTFGPNTTASMTAPFSDPTGAMGSGSKVGSYVLEAVQSSLVSNDGTTDISNIALEPYAGGDMALSPSTAALVPVTGSSVPPDRSSGVQFVAMAPDDYVAGSFTNTYTGTFGANDAIGTNWRSMGIYDEDGQQFLFTFLFNAAQKKPGTHSLTLHFRKTWNRDLS